MTRIDSTCTFTAHSLNLTIFEDAQQLDLNVAAISPISSSRRVPSACSKWPACWWTALHACSCPKSSLSRSDSGCGAVHAHEGSSAAAAADMNGMRNQFFARTRRLISTVAELSATAASSRTRPAWLRLSDQTLKPEVLRFSSKRTHLGAQSAAFHCTFDRQQQRIGTHRLLDIVGCPCVWLRRRRRQNLGLSSR